MSNKMKRVTIVIHSADTRSAEGHVAQVAAALARGDEAMALLAPRRRNLGTGIAPNYEEVLERVEYWSEDVPETPTGPPAWGSATPLHGDSTGIPSSRIFGSATFETVILPAIKALRVEGSFEWTRDDRAATYTVFARSECAAKLLLHL